MVYSALGEGERKSIHGYVSEWLKLLEGSPGVAQCQSSPESKIPSTSHQAPVIYIFSGFCGKRNPGLTNLSNCNCYHDRVPKLLDELIKEANSTEAEPMFQTALMDATQNLTVA
ncbi:hypothetical protein ASPZODRAFT_140771 [Penicilliopsis zonata CBS 506.65]|uniref:Uncharacterized protein n=1 Tax=Penicilliopsis zonata CBS 506.65 TaxID=1073090 RepID=A0A1L9SMR0_9EURO|nr:hypothetical protein ASPZODRAFT_140771 [Penicilliopsis zonata CBS 506.65]OJJ48478.1 hypothetical protein ASPZODRAFT_140771 [Penicilliopsis zonata CBS 506.65]